MKIAFIIFTKNEEKIIEKVILDTLKVLENIRDYSFQVFLWDDSIDNTALIAKKLATNVIKGSNKSLGISYYEAMKHFTASYEYDFIMTMDGDGQVDVMEIPKYIKAIEDNCDMIVGSRFKSGNKINYNYPYINHIGIKLLSLLISFTCRKKFTDSHGGIRIMKREVAKRFKFLGRHSYVQETIIDAHSRGYRVSEISSSWNERKFDESRVVANPYIYARKMSLPLLLRANIHLLFSILLVILAITLKNIIFLGVGAIFLSFEIIKKIIFIKNSEKLGVFT